ncbi:YihY/virulence factor BrkB family protein [Agrococcus sp. Marseille-Q4369]|uniref:YihY/virulence factor BrkB family protein n=1 Tax=Agrococcus sp. Marseille-Q4369 TaxID=2810513 RepID=UPI001B8B0F09|nr:YihY/virulence factor BrkB family protein [Agrococcus sp. Marseille-Q4369]QUW18697.1 YihY/virulence factor BrkB family protein [Agrococcus sp. Marseille-Q4369]
MSDSSDRLDATLEAADAPAPDHDAKPDSPPKLEGASWKYALKRAIKEFGTDGGTDLAAMLTYYMVLSLAPGLLAVFSIIALVLANNASTVTSLVDDLAQRLPEDYAPLVVDLVETMTSSATGGVIALIIGIATAVWSASAYVKAFSRSMNIIYGIEEGRGLIKQTATMLLITIALLVGVVLLLVSLALNESLVEGVLGPIAEPLGLGGLLAFMLQTFLPVWAWVKWPVMLAIVVAMIALLYYLAPNVQQPKFTWVSLGSIFAIVGIALAAVGLFLYFTLLTGYSAYGTIGTVMALLFALWIFNIVLILGAEVDAETERARQLQTGIEAEETIQLPPRSTKKVEKKAEARDKLEAEGREIREEHSDGADDADDRARDGDDGRSSRSARDGDARASVRASSEDRPAGKRKFLGIFPRKD